MREAMEASTYNVLQVFAPLSASDQLVMLRQQTGILYGPTTANFGPRYLHSTGQLHKGGPRDVIGIQIIQWPTSEPVRVEGRSYTFHDHHMAQATSDWRAMSAAGWPVGRCSS